MKNFTRNLGKAVGRLTGSKPSGRKDSENMSQTTTPSEMPPPPPVGSGAGSGANAGGGGAGSMAGASTGNELNDFGMTMEGMTPPSPMRKRQPIVNNPAEFESVDMELGMGETGQAQARAAASVAAVAAPKSEEARKLLSGALREHFLFSHLPEEEMEACVGVMKPHECGAGEVILRQGDRGTHFFVLETGAAEAFVGETKVMEYGPGGTFGELALIYSCERQASVVSTQASRLWSVDLPSFRRLLATTATSKVVSRCEFLRKVHQLQELSTDQVTKLADALEERTFKSGEYIIRQGEQGDEFFLIESGSVTCTQARSATDPTEVPLLTLVAGEYFGEMALMLDEPRAANCIAVDREVKCLSLDRRRFFQLLGPIQTIMQNNMRLTILKVVPLLSKLTEEELCHVADTLCVQSFEDGEYIIREKEEGSRFYIINEGEVRCTCLVPGTGEEKEVMRLGKTEFFGERALLKNEPRAANVIACGYVDCLVLERHDFNALLGPLEAILGREAERRGQVGETIVGPRKLSRPTVNLRDLQKIRTLGTGTFGRVKLVQDVRTHQVYALKCMQKTHIAKSHQERNIMNEKNILMACEHPFILDLICTYNTPNELLMLTELLLGGELWMYIYEKFKAVPRSRMGGFVLPAAQFFSGCVVLCLQYLHKMSVAYRDLKPENLLLAQDGYLKIIDFGFAKRIPFKKGAVLQTKSFTLCGTPDYLAPELVLSRGHDKSVDYWALGCFIYELFVGRTPFTDPRQGEIFKKAIWSERFLQFPAEFPRSAEKLVRELLVPNPIYRLGNASGGVKDIMDHAMFKETNFDWTALYEKRLTPPHVPQVRDMLDTSNFDPVSEDEKIVPFTGQQKRFEGF